MDGLKFEFNAHSRDEGLFGLVKAFMTWKGDSKYSLRCSGAPDLILGPGLVICHPAYCML